MKASLVLGVLILCSVTLAAEPKPPIRRVGPDIKRPAPSVSIKRLRERIEKNPQRLSLRLPLFRAYLRQGNFSRAADLLGKVDPNDLPEKNQGLFYQLRARAREKCGDSRGAYQDFSKLAKLRPGDAEVRYHLEQSRLQMQIGKTKQPGLRKDLWKKLGQVHEKQHKYSQAITAYQHAGDSAGVARVKNNEETDRFNKQVEEENKAIKAMEEEARKLEAELKALEGGGGNGGDDKDD